MSRRPPSDTFTRFTSNSIHVSSQHQASSPSSTFSYQPPTPRPLKPSSSSSTANTSPLSRSHASPGQVTFNSSPGPDGETPAQKVARLRAAARAAKETSRLSPTDRLIDRGRVWADRIHRVTTYGLIGITGVSGVIALYGLVSLVGHNRRQKRAWIEREMDRLRDAQQAFLRGDASAEQLHLLEQERAGEEMEIRRKADKERKKQDSIWTSIKGLVGAGASAGEMGREESRLDAEIGRRGGNARGREKMLEDGWIEGEVRPASSTPPSSQSLAAPSAVPVAESGIPGVGVDSKGRPVPAGRVEKVRQTVSHERRKGEDEVVARTGVRGGPFDVLADNVATAVAQTTGVGGRDWLSWVRGSKS